jgi:Peptidase family M28
MVHRHFDRVFLLIAVTAVMASLGFGQTEDGPAARAAETHSTSAAPAICFRCIRAHMEFLASDALRGRGSATEDELVAATYIASELAQYGIQPAGDGGGFLQHVPLIRRKFSSPAQLRFMAAGKNGTAEEVTWKHELEMLLLHAGQADVSGPLEKIAWGGQPAGKVRQGAFVLLEVGNNDEAETPDADDARKLVKAGAAAVMIPADAYHEENWKQIGERLLSRDLEIADASGTGPLDTSNILMLDDDSFSRVKGIPDGTAMHLVAPMDDAKTASTWNVLGKISGSDPKLRTSVILFSAHMDHLGVGVPVNGDAIYNGADDDASGTSAVMELARLLGQGHRPRRTVVFALFGSEEAGELGSKYFLDHSPVKLRGIAAALEFEMIGRPDPAVPKDDLWLTGWERSDLGPALAAHGAHLVADPHPEQNFFMRSDNYALAQRGVVAQTISSFGLHPDYHQPSDDLSHIDFQHMDEAMQRLAAPLEWLVDSNFTPKWGENGQP